MTINLFVYFYGATAPYIQQIIALCYEFLYSYLSRQNVKDFAIKCGHIGTIHL